MCGILRGMRHKQMREPIVDVTIGDTHYEIWMLRIPRANKRIEITMYMIINKEGKEEVWDRSLVFDMDDRKRNQNIHSVLTALFKVKHIKDEDVIWNIINQQ